MHARIKERGGRELVRNLFYSIMSCWLTGFITVSCGPIGANSLLETIGMAGQTGGPPRAVG
jgi:hypothetical protein